MPQRHEPCTLKLCCMKQIVNDFDNICYGCKSKSQMGKMLEEETYLDVIGPFVNMPSVTLSEMMTSWTDRKFLGRRHLHLIVQPHMTNITLANVRDVHHCVGFIENRCKNLRSLDLSYQRALGPPILVPLMPKLKEIRSLNLNMTDTIDQVLRLIGDHCPHIQVLDIRNTSITENGLKVLCYDEETNTVRCQNLQKLLVQGCYISSFSVAYLIQKLPHVREVDHPRMFEVFAILFENGVKLSSDGSAEGLHLNQFNSIKERFVNSDLVDFAVALSPNITNVTIDDTPIENEWLSKFICLMNLSHLRISNNEEFLIDFFDGVLPLLIERGKRIRSILLSKFTRIDINGIGEYCPKLENLALSNIIEYDRFHFVRSDMFTNLQTLELWSRPGIDTLDAAIIKQLLCFCLEIQNILLSSVNELNDEIFYQILQVNPMKRLTRLTLNECSGISVCVLNDLLSMENQLNFLRIWSCRYVQQEHKNQLQKRISEENCDVYLEWYPYECTLPIDYM